MDKILDYLNEYSKLIGEGEFSYPVVISTLSTILIVMIIRYIVWYRNKKDNNKDKLPKLRTELLSLLSIEYIVDITISFILISLFRSTYLVWNYIVSPAIGIGAGVIIEYKFFRSLFDFNLIFLQKSKSKSSKKESSDDNNTVNNNIIITTGETSHQEEDTHDGNDKLEAMSKKIKGQTTKESSTLDLSVEERVDRIEGRIDDISTGLTTTMDIVHDISEGLAGFREYLERIEKNISSINTRVTDIQYSAEENKAVEARVRLLRFNIDLIVAKRQNTTLPKDLFEQTIIDIDHYHNYCNLHPDFKNTITESAAAHITAEYQKCMDSDGFLRY